MLNSDAFAAMKPGVRVVNVGRGPVINEQALIAALATGQVHSAALDVFEQEPLPLDSPLRSHPACIFGSHNASNTVDGVERTSYKAIQLLAGFLQEATACTQQAEKPESTLGRRACGCCARGFQGLRIR